MSVDFKKEGDLICEALVREMYQSRRWTAIVEAWQALMHVRQQQKNHCAEMEHLCRTPSGGMSSGSGGVSQ